MDRAADHRDGRGRRAIVAHHLLDGPRGLQIGRIGHAVRDDGRFERNDGHAGTARGRDDLAVGANQLALQVVLHIGLDEPADPETVRALVTELLATVDPQDLHAPTREMLDEFVRRAG